MAFSPFKAPESPLNRSRSSSCSSPIRNRIVYQEVYALGANTLLRSYSCDQVFDKDASGRTFQTTQIHVSSVFTPEKKINGELVERKPNKPRKLALQFFPDQQNIKNRKQETKKLRNVLMSALRRTMILSWLMLTVISACLFYFFITFRECSYEWNLVKTESDLQENIFGQEQALSKINSVLKICNKTKDIHVMVFTGGVGVGKTYASSIISQNFPWSSNKFITYSEYFTADADKLLKQKLSTCGYNLLIVDGLSIKETIKAINFISLLNNNRKADENLLIILIFRVHDETERSEILNEFKKTYISIYHVPFRPISKDAVIKCFTTEIQRQEVEISNSELNKLVKDKMKHIDIVGGPSGCKGVADEVSSFKKGI